MTHLLILMKLIGTLDNLRVTQAKGTEKGVIVFVHDAWHGGWCWEEGFTTVFSQNGYRCVTFDLPYHDRAGRRVDIGNARMRDYMLTLQHVVKRVGGEPILIGHSLGARLIENCLGSLPCRMAVLMAPPPPDRPWRTTLRVMRKPYMWKATLTKNMHLAISTPSRAAWAFFSDQMSEEFRNRYAGQLCDESLPVLIDMLRKRPAPATSTQVPVIVFGGANDRLFTQGDMQRSAAYHNCGMVLMSGMGHDMMLEPHAGKLASIMINCIESKLGIPIKKKVLTPLDSMTWDEEEKVQAPEQKRWWF